MIILESEWDRAAGVRPPEGENDPNNQTGAMTPGYIPTTPSDGPPPLPPRIPPEEDNELPPFEPTNTQLTPSSASIRGSIHGYPESLPGYQESSDPSKTSPVVYVFQNVGHSYNTMVLQSQRGQIPVYHISVHMNCFIPTSYITIIRRGDSEFGEEVGQFEMGSSIRKGTVTINGRERLIDAAVVKAGNRMTMGKSASPQRTWQWKFDNDHTKHLSWTYDSPVKYCYWGSRPIGEGSPLLATFTPAPLTPRADGRPSPPTTMKIHPEGQHLFDHILISALIIERRRLTPSS